jgi:AcrR family transcriptional regulator
MREQAASGRPRRRTQSERSALTRERVLRAVVDCIAEEGLQKTTAARIAERSGVTWGAIVHQFGDKDSVLLAVMERSFENLSKNLLESLAEGPKSPRDRVSLLVDETWKRFTNPSFHAFLEIALHSRSAADGNRKSRQEAVIMSLAERIWSDLLGDLGGDPKTIDTARNLTFAALLGMAIQAMIGPREPRFTRELGALKQNVLRMLDLEEER